MSVSHKLLLQSCHQSLEYSSPCGYQASLFINQKIHLQNFLEVLYGSISAGILMYMSTTGIKIKPDLSPEDRLTESLLLIERRSLIDSGSVRAPIRIRGTQLFVGDRLHGKVINGVFHRSNSLGNHASSLNNLGNSPGSQSPPSSPTSSPPASQHKDQDTLTQQ